MSKVIEFYVPKNYRPQLKWVPEFEVGKVIEFPSESKITAEPHYFDWIEDFWESLLQEKSR